MKKIILSIIFVSLFSFSGCIQSVDEAPYVNTNDLLGDFPIALFVNAIELEDASNLSHGAGSFDNPGRRLVDANGKDYQYTYGERLDDPSGIDIYDDNSSGDFAPGKYFRIVVDGKNITDPSGLNLKVIAKSLDSIVSPPADECYVDPLRGMFVMPRPVYWSRCENGANLTSPDILESSLSISTSSLGDYYWNVLGGKYDSYAVCWTNSLPFVQSYSRMRIINSKGWEKGTISFWMALGNESTSHTGQMIEFGGGSNVVRFWEKPDYHEQSIVINGVVKDTKTNNWLSDWKRIYIIWDVEGGTANLTGGHSIRVFVDGSSHLISDAIFTPSMLRHYCGNGSSSSTLGLAYIENIKIWDHVVSEDPSWEYNGNGNEEALHEIYGSDPVTDSYRPENVMVGYYYLGN